MAADTIPGPRRLAGEGHTILVQDGPIFVNDAGKGAKYWSPVGERIHVPHAGSHGKFAAFGALPGDGRQFFRTHGWFDSRTFVRYLREMHRKFGRIAVVVDRAPQRRAAVAGDYLEGCGGEVLLSGLPTGSPHTDAVEGAWRRTKRATRDSEHHPGVGEMRAAVGECLRVTRHRPGTFAYLHRKAIGCA